MKPQDLRPEILALANDPGQDRLTDAILVPYFNAAIRKIVLLAPLSHTVTDAFQLGAGVKQSAPAGTVAMIDVHRNMGTNGTTPGQPITRVNKSDLDLFDPTWTQAQAQQDVDHWAYNPDQDKKTFYVTPPQPSASRNYVEATRATFPSLLTAIGDTLPLADEYSEAIKNFVLAEAWGAETEEGSAAKANDYRKAGMLALGISPGR